MKRSSEPRIARCSITGRWRCAVLADIAGVEPLGQHEIDLQRAALPVAADRVAQHEFELRAIERALAGIERVGAAPPPAHASRSAASARSQTASLPARFAGRSENLTVTS